MQMKSGKILSMVDSPTPNYITAVFNFPCSQKFDLLLSNSNLGGHRYLKKKLFRKKGGEKIKYLDNKMGN